jgi:hypothetical protein
MFRYPFLTEILIEIYKRPGKSKKNTAYLKKGCPNSILLCNKQTYTKKQKKQDVSPTQNKPPSINKPNYTTIKNLKGTNKKLNPNPNCHHVWQSQLQSFRTLVSLSRL